MLKRKLKNKKWSWTKQREKSTILDKFINNSVISLSLFYNWYNSKTFTHSVFFFLFIGMLMRTRKRNGKRLERSWRRVKKTLIVNWSLLECMYFVCNQIHRMCILLWGILFPLESQPPSVNVFLFKYWNNIYSFLINNNYIIIHIIGVNATKNLNCVVSKSWLSLPCLHTHLTRQVFHSASMTLLRCMMKMFYQHYQDFRL